MSVVCGAVSLMRTKWKESVDRTDQQKTEQPPTVGYEASLPFCILYSVNVTEECIHGYEGE